jgi:hypothetical protein
MSIINCTPHKIVYHGLEVREFEPSGTVIRVLQDSDFVDPVADLVTQVVTYGEVINYPDVDDSDVVIVSQIVLNALRGKDLPGTVIAPATGPGDNPVRDEKGMIKGVTRFNV